ncbi:DHHA1 domain-containing protein [Sphingomonas sp. MMS24-JH45]
MIGIVAGRLKEKLGRPAIVIALDEAGVGKGSGRSITGVDLGQAVLAAKEHGLLVAGGGHAMAAGLTVAADWRRRTGGVSGKSGWRTWWRRRGRIARCWSIGPRARRATAELVAALEAGGPYGTGWPSPRVAIGPVRAVKKVDVVGNGHVRAIVAGDDGRSLKAMAFRAAADTPLGEALLAAGPGRRLWLAGRAKLDESGGRGEAELHLDDAAWVS